MTLLKINNKLRLVIYNDTAARWNGLHRVLWTGQDRTFYIQNSHKASVNTLWPQRGFPHPRPWTSYSSYYVTGVSNLKGVLA